MLPIMGFVSKILLRNIPFHVIDVPFPIVASSSTMNKL